MKFNLTITDVAYDELTLILQKIHTNLPSAIAAELGFVPSNQPSGPVKMPDVQHQPQPTYVAPQPAAPINELETDVNGLPWDTRIHSGSQNKTDKGVWKKRKGIQEPEINAVEAELRSKLAAVSTLVNAPAPTPLPAPVPFVDPVENAPINVMQNPAELFKQPQPAPVDPRIMVAPVAQPIMSNQPAQVQVQDFQILMNTITMLFTNQTIDPVYMQNLNGRLGIQAITDISQDPARIANAFAMLKQDGKIQ